MQHNECYCSFHWCANCKKKPFSVSWLFNEIKGLLTVLIFKVELIAFNVNLIAIKWWHLVCSSRMMCSSPGAVSPSGPVYHESCVCPERDPSVWRSALQCPEDEPQIQQDFLSFPSIDLQRLLREVPERFSRRGGLLHYSLVNNQLHRRSLGKYTDFKMFSDEMLLSLARKVRLTAFSVKLVLVSMTSAKYCLL